MSAAENDPTLLALSARASSVGDPTLDVLNAHSLSGGSVESLQDSLAKWPAFAELKGAAGAVTGAASGFVRASQELAADPQGYLAKVAGSVWDKIRAFGNAAGHASAVGQGLEEPDPNAAILDYARGAAETLTNPEKRGAVAGNVGLGLLGGRLLGAEAGELKFGTTAAESAIAPKIEGTALKAGDVPLPMKVAETPPRAAPSELASDLNKPPAPSKQSPAPFVSTAVEFKPQADIVEPGLELPAAEQARRRRVLSEVGLSGDTQFRNSALSGDPLSAGTDGQIAKIDSPPGRFMRGLLNNERQAVTGYTHDTIEQTGGHVGDLGANTQTDDAIRGRSLVGPNGALTALDSHLEGLNKQLYQAADKVSEGRPLPAMPKLSEALGETADFQNFSGGDRLLSGVKAKMQKLGMMDEDGNVKSATVRQSEALRQFINEGDEAYPLRARLRDAIDEDVFSQSGEDIYKPARALYKLRKDTLENPKGINQIMSSEGPEGINRKTAFVDVMPKLETMDPDQLNHIMGVLRSMPGELNPQAQAAIGNIQAHFATKFEKVLNSQGEQLNAKGAHNFLASNSESLNSVFQDKPEVLHRMYAATEAAKILHYNASYPGAAAQAANLSRAGVMPTLIHKGSMLGGEFLGSAMGLPGVGTLLGEAAGSKLSGSASERAALAKAKGRAAPQLPE